MARTVTVAIDEDVFGALLTISGRRKQSVGAYLRDFIDEYGRDEWIPEAEHIEIAGRDIDRERRLGIRRRPSDVSVRGYMRRKK